MRTNTRAKAGPTVHWRTWIQSLSNQARLAVREREEAAEASTGPTPQIRQSDLLRFYEAYEDLVEVVCDGANYGPTPKLSVRYEEIRRLARHEYGNIRPYVLAYVPLAAEDAEQIAVHGERGCDAFEALMAAPSLDAFLRHDDGLMIDRISRTRDALSRYGAALRGMMEERANA